MNQVCFLLGLLISLAAMSGCTGSRRPRTIVVAWPTVISFDGQTPTFDDTRIRDIVADVLKIEPKDASADMRPELIAWALKRFDDLPPRLLEEALVLVPPGISGSAQWSLLVATRRSGESNWRLGSSVEGAWESNMAMLARPDIGAIACFVEKTNFGHNESSGLLRILEVVVNSEYAALSKTLEAGIPEEEKRQRFLKICSPE